MALFIFFECNLIPNFSHVTCFIYELNHNARSTMHEPQRTNHNAGLRRTNHNARSTSHEPQTTTHDQRRTNHDQRRSTSHDRRRTTNHARLMAHDQRRIWANWAWLNYFLFILILHSVTNWRSYSSGATPACWDIVITLQWILVWISSVTNALTDCL